MEYRQGGGGGMPGPGGLGGQAGVQPGGMQGGAPRQGGGRMGQGQGGYQAPQGAPPPMANGAGGNLSDYQGRIQAIQQQIMQLQAQGAPPSVLMQYRSMMQQAQFEMQQFTQKTQNAQQQAMQQAQQQAMPWQQYKGVGNVSGDHGRNMASLIMANAMGQGGGSRGPGW